MGLPIVDLGFVVGQGDGACDDDKSWATEDRPYHVLINKDQVAAVQADVALEAYRRSFRQDRAIRLAASSLASTRGIMCRGYAR